MKKIHKITAGILALSLLALPCVQPGQATLAAAKHVQTKIDNQQKGKNVQSAWDKSSLSFITTGTTSNGISATIKNGQDSRAMQGEVVYEVYWSEDGNPKDGTVIASGEVKALAPGETQVLTYHSDKMAEGNYMFKAYQRLDHPGTGVLWSESIKVNEISKSNEQIEPQRPLDQFFQSSVNGGEATFTVPEGMKPVEISFTSYSYPEGTGPQDYSKPYEVQTPYDNVTKVYGPGTYTVDVNLPNGYFQTDLYLGSEIKTLTDSGHPMDKIIDADSGLN
ncbi:hypothetical protein [Niallia sp. 01092]|uniref:hypothetical protein n=1 Tax=unclassified Niallia TaxID=2837522 RepID=UPI003FD2DB20